jgi:hypothetical protein
MEVAMHDQAVFYIEVPLENLMYQSDIDAHLRKRHWHEHINFFSVSSIHQLVRRAGFNVKSSKILDIVVANKVGHVIQLACTN